MGFAVVCVFGILFLCAVIGMIAAVLQGLGLTHPSSSTSYTYYEKPADMDPRMIYTGNKEWDDQTNDIRSHTFWQS